jgi:hypothetical protein
VAIEGLEREEDDYRKYVMKKFLGILAASVGYKPEFDRNLKYVGAEKPSKPKPMIPPEIMTRKEFAKWNQEKVAAKTGRKFKSFSKTQKYASSLFKKKQEVTPESREISQPPKPEGSREKEVSDSPPVQEEEGKRFKWFGFCCFFL